MDMSAGSCYPWGVAKILSQPRMSECSEWRALENAGNFYSFHSLGNVCHLCYKVIAKEGRIWRLTPTPKGLHTHAVDKNNPKLISGQRIINNDSIFGWAVRHAEL